MKSPSFKAELEEYKEWVATWSLAPVDQWQQKLALVVIDNWRKSASVESIWTKLTTHDQRTQSTYLFGAVCPDRGTGAALVLPVCNSEAMQLHLDEIATKVAPGAHAILILDQAGWHGAKQLRIPANISLLPLPPRAPELNSQENIWQFMRQNRLSNRVFKSFDDIVDYCCYAWNTLIDQPWKIMSIAQRDWANIGHPL
jgi:putative transposase